MRRTNKPSHPSYKPFLLIPLFNPALAVLFFLTISANSVASGVSGIDTQKNEVAGNNPSANSASGHSISANKVSDSNLLSILKRMSDADYYQNYRGTFILRKSDNLSTLQVTHGAGDNGDWENLRSLSGESKNVYKRNAQIVSVYPERQVITVRNTIQNKSLHPRLPANIDQLGLFYTMKRLEDDRIANHQTVVVDLLPIDQYRYGYRYWVDKNTGMLLRCDVYDEEKSIIEQMMFTSLDYLSEPPAETFDLKKFDDFQRKNMAKLGSVEPNSAEPGHAAGSSERVKWAVNRLPKGFMLTQSVVRNLQPQPKPKPKMQVQTAQRAESEVDQVTNKAVRKTAVPQAFITHHSTIEDVVGTESVVAMPVGAEPVVIELELPAKKLELVHMVYSDGLASVSVFIENNRSGQNHLHGASSMGSVNAYGSSLGNYFVTVVGEVPANTVRAMALSTAPMQ